MFNTLPYALYGSVMLLNLVYVYKVYDRMIHELDAKYTPIWLTIT
jgi:hypothetical protein